MKLYFRLSSKTSLWRFLLIVLFLGGFSVNGQPPPETEIQATPIARGALANKKTYRSFYEAIQNPLDVFKLNMSGMQIQKIPKEIGEMKNLQELILSKNQIKEIPVEIGQCKNLQIINLFKNRIEVIPVEIKDLTHLQMLFLGRNKISRAPNWISGLKHLKILDVMGNPMIQSEFEYIKRSLPKTQVGI